MFLLAITKSTAMGWFSVPGPIDTHVHYGVYSSIDKAAKTESHAAAIGGITNHDEDASARKTPFLAHCKAQLDAASHNHYVDYAIHASVF